MSKPSNTIATIKIPGDTSARPIIPYYLAYSSDNDYVATLPELTADSIIALTSDIPTAVSELTNDSGYITSESDTLATVTNRGATTTTAIQIQNGSASGCFTIGGNVQSTGLSSSTRKLGRLTAPVYENTSNVFGFVSCDSFVSGSSVLNGVEFGSRQGDGTSYGPDYMSFSIATSHGSTTRNNVAQFLPTKVQLFNHASGSTSISSTPGTSLTGMWEFYNSNTFQNNGFSYELPDEDGTIALTDDIPTKTSDLTNDSGFITTDTNYYPTTFTWTNGTTAGPTGSLTGTGMSAVSFAAIPSASASQSGIITTGTQTISGTKTFSTSPYIQGDIYIYDVASAEYGSIGINDDLFYVLSPNSTMFWDMYNRTLDLHSDSDSVTYTYTFPTANGTVALTSDIPTAVSELTNDSGYLTSHITSIDGLSGGTLTSAIILDGGDASSGVANMQLGTTGQITAQGTTHTLFGRSSSTNLLVGHGSYTLTMRGSATRPTYNGSNMALYSDIGSATLTITQNDSTIGSFSANATSSVSVAITTPTIIDLR